MKKNKNFLAFLIVTIALFYGISNSFSSIGGPGQNACYHNNEFWKLASSATSCSGDPGGHMQVSFNVHPGIDHPDCLIEIRPIN